MTAKNPSQMGEIGLKTKVSKPQNPRICAQIALKARNPMQTSLLRARIHPRIATEMITTHVEDLEAGLEVDLEMTIGFGGITPPTPH